MQTLRNVILVVALLGAAIFSIAFLTSYANPVFVEGVARNLIRDRIAQEAQERIDALDAGYLTQSAERLSERYAADIARVRQQLSNALPALIAETIVRMRDLGCECRRIIESHLQDGMRWRIASALQARERLAEFIRTKYMEVAEKLTLEFRIFTASNAVVLLVLAFAARTKPRAGLLLLPASSLLVLAAAVTGYFYLFQQDWLRTLLFGNYVGFAYLGYLGLVFALLADLVFNRGRVTARLFNLFLQLIGGVVSVAPC